MIFSAKSFKCKAEPLDVDINLECIFWIEVVRSTLDVFFQRLDEFEVKLKIAVLNAVSSQNSIFS